MQQFKGCVRKTTDLYNKNGRRNTAIFIIVNSILTPMLKIFLRSYSNHPLHLLPL